MPEYAELCHSDIGVFLICRLSILTGIVFKGIVSPCAKLGDRHMSKATKTAAELEAMILSKMRHLANALME